MGTAGLPFGSCTLHTVTCGIERQHKGVTTHLAVMIVTGPNGPHGCSTPIVGVSANHGTMRLAFMMMLPFTAVQALYSAQHSMQLLENDTNKDEILRTKINQVELDIEDDANETQLDRDTDEA